MDPQHRSHGYSTNGVIVPDILMPGSCHHISVDANPYGAQWSFDDVMTKLESKMTKACNDVWKVSKEKKCSMRAAAYMLAVNRVAQAAAYRFSL